MKIPFKNKMKKIPLSITIILLITLISACSPDSNDTPQTESALSSLNDTGVILYTQDFPPRATTDPAPTDLLTSTIDTSAPGQDADKGTDTDPTNSNNDGIEGFRFSKLDASGTSLTNQSKSYSEEKWHCVKDENTGLTWEVKTLSGFQQQGTPYTWYEPNESLNGGFAGEISDNGIPCYGELSQCNTHAYIAAINALNNGKGLCNSNKWRLPLRNELRTLVDYSVTSGAMIDTNFFPNASLEDTWTSQTSFYNTEDGTRAWELHFDTGQSEEHRKISTSVTVRLVH